MTWPLRSDLVALAGDREAPEGLPRIAPSRAIRGPTLAHRPSPPPPLLQRVVPRDVRLLSPSNAGDGDGGDLGYSPTVWRDRRREFILWFSFFPAVRQCSDGFVGRTYQKGMWPWLTSRRHLQSDLIWPVSLAVVAISSVGGGWPEAGWSDLEIRHLVLVASPKDIVVGENRADGRP